MLEQTVSVKIINRSQNALPEYQTNGSAGMDISAANPSPITLAPMQRALIPTGLYIELPEGFEAQIRPRSGLALRHGLSLPNSPATIDSDYRGELTVLVINLGDQNFTVEYGMRIAQLIVAPVSRALWIPVDELEESERAANGFGSTGVK